MIKQVLIVTLLFSVVAAGYSQPSIRPEDHFWRKRIVNRIPLNEKMNKPLVFHESPFYGNEGKFKETDGLIATLLNGVKAGKYVAYHPETWEKIMNYEDLVARMVEFDQALMGSDEGFDDESDSFEQPVNEEDEWGSSEEWTLGEEEAEEWATPFDEGDASEGQGKYFDSTEPDLAQYEEVIHLVEDWIFDKTRSDMLQVPSFFEIIWTDPTGSLPEKVLARFAWKDVKEQLDMAQWKSRYNDAEARSLREAFELRLFHSIMINVGGEPIRSLQEAERRRQEIIEFEHHLWSY
ncbi:MAG: hypothetical protein R8P61_31435 [Bacteroidia bacterium]|nr:hypothetical protein [Bacteroidia bacterium]